MTLQLSDFPGTTDDIRLDAALMHAEWITPRELYIGGSDSYLDAPTASFPGWFIIGPDTKRVEIARRARVRTQLLRYDRRAARRAKRR